MIAAPAVIAIEGVALFTGLFSIIGKYSVIKSTSKAEKHEKIKKIASTKLDTVASHVSKVLSDNKMTDEEFRLILEELEKYEVMKEEVRSKTKNKIANETEETLIERGRQEIAEEYLNTPPRNRDETFGIRKEKDGLYYIAKKQAAIAYNNNMIEGEKFKGTPGLWELIMTKDQTILRMRIMKITRG